ncbi:putative transmembrane protein [Toxoplasma gondii GAB2-2007-GAL-DOM2]|uniref:Putative transmembrane protein n=7 Tax=Toxoplasma gondii TaxID=5811 RepID=B9QHC7_TOXGV|nr:putative transmembrane protein [Toxoplasma gondii VEG]KFG36256.1 putative transmembrane protein [Toxoplasma gondii p89]KFG41586.1 putative transmembrane protein [Toxoplasma gondii GAB2-2007-GAL-DOM2]KFH03586.1 putative transmembrane protein [Toxoplasma gondii VAND]KFH14569.1 putative transmembrane protein [Toxoplasma gondii MAS]PUA87519.1 putative transmembrane protein [Toxoplasma gondii TgCATBr9]RQX74902.1 putative transmembrane protein [Toxoplasma gondii CAST]
MQHPTSFFGLSRRANTRHLLFLCLASTFLAAASLYSSLSSFAVQAAGTEGNGGRHAMYTAGASGISGERQQGEQDETAMLTGRMYDGEQDQVDAQEAPMELQERSQSHSRSKSDGFFEYGYRSPRLQKKKKMSLLTHLLPALAFVVILNLGAAAVYLHSQSKP